MRRRDFLAATFAALAVQAAPAAMRPAAAQAQKRRFIDVHCHLFNAHDLPIRGFLEQVVLPADHKHAKQVKMHESTFRELTKILIDFIRHDTPTPKKEELLLTEIANRTAMAPTRAMREVSERELLKTILREIWWPKETQDKIRMRVGGNYISGVALIQIKKEILNEIFKDLKPDRENDPTMLEITPDYAADQLYDSNGPLGRGFRWAMLFIRNRFELVDNLHALHQGRTELLTPALVDLSLWVNDEDHHPIHDQVQVLEQISLRPQGVRVHGFIPFCPLRQATHFQRRRMEVEPLKTVKDAIGEGNGPGKGFIGVKLYPPMGFRPAANAKLGERFPKRTALAVLKDETGEKIDAALWELFGWCAGNDVPVMAHCNNSYGSAPGYAERSHPKYWRPVLENPERSRLRVNLAHFGDFDEAFEKGKLKPKGAEQSWEWEVGRMWEDFPDAKIYADISYFSEIYENSGHRRDIARMLAQFRERFPMAAKRLMYGSDWMMVGLEEKFSRRYPDDIAEFLRRDAGFGNAELDDILFGNAADFLGLRMADREKGTRGRLERFYAFHNLDAGWLEKFA